MIEGKIKNEKVKNEEIKNEKIKNEEIEIQLLLEAINMKYGYDFTDYSRAYMKRRIQSRLFIDGFSNVSEMLHKILYDKEFFNVVLTDFSINVTEMFRDPSFYKAFRENVIPILKMHSFIRIWHAGCSTGEEVYSMAILLKEEGLYERTQIYATDFNKVVLRKAKEGIYHIDDIKEYTYNYQKSGGKSSFSDYYVAQYDTVIFDSSLKKKITFAQHNLVTDGVFGEMNVIICRNVLIYFNNEMQNNVIKLFLDSLASGSFLCLGSKENIKFTTSEDDFYQVSCSERIYRKK